MLPGSDQDNWSWSSDKVGFVYTGAGEVMSPSVGLDAAEKTGGFIEGTPAAQAGIPKLLRKEGVKVSLKHVSKDAATFGKWAGRAGKIYAAYSAYQRYQKC